jgi:hypothetical protein
MSSTDSDASRTGDQPNPTPTDGDHIAPPVDGRRLLPAEKKERAEWMRPIGDSMTNIAQAEQIELSFGAIARRERAETFFRESSPGN